MPIKYPLLIVFQFQFLFTLAQQDPIPLPPPRQELHAPSLILPAALTLYGFAALKLRPLQSFDHDIRRWVWLDHPHGQIALDDYLQYAPGAAVYVLNFLGVKGRNNFRDRTILYALSNIMMGATVLSLKRIVYAPRPDGSGNDGFPSGHVATAFVAAEFLRQEFKDRSPWYGVAGYTTAILTGFLRVYNDKHWFSELTTGAGIGILSTWLSYQLYPCLQQKWCRRHHPATPLP